ncbi:hypothetical protein ACWD4N_40280, partial [Streptomyces sp. NPDC002586]
GSGVAIRAPLPLPFPREHRRAPSRWDSGIREGAAGAAESRDQRTRRRQSGVCAGAAVRVT